MIRQFLTSGGIEGQVSDERWHQGYSPNTTSISGEPSTHSWTLSSLMYSLSFLAEMKNVRFSAGSVIARAVPSRSASVDSLK